MAARSAKMLAPTIKTPRNTGDEVSEQSIGGSAFQGENERSGTIFPSNTRDTSPAADAPHQWKF
jgi:hypothetical protein